MSRARSALISYLYNDQLGNRNLHETQSLYNELKSKPGTSTMRADVSLSVKWIYHPLSFFLFKRGRSYRVYVIRVLLQLVFLHSWHAVLHQEEDLTHAASQAPGSRLWGLRSQLGRRIRSLRRKSWRSRRLWTFWTVWEKEKKENCQGIMHKYGWLSGLCSFLRMCSAKYPRIVHSRVNTMYIHVLYQRWMCHQRF